MRRWAGQLWLFDRPPGLTFREGGLNGPGVGDLPLGLSFRSGCLPLPPLNFGIRRWAGQLWLDRDSPGEGNLNRGCGGALPFLWRPGPAFHGGFGDGERPVVGPGELAAGGLPGRRGGALLGLWRPGPAFHAGFGDCERSEDDPDKTERWKSL